MSWKRKMFRDSIRDSIKKRQRDFRRSQSVPNHRGEIELVKTKIKKER